MTDTSLLIGLVGDLMIGRQVNESLAYVPSSSIWGNTLPLFHQTDLNIGNLEAALSTHEERIDKVFNFKSDPKNVQVLIDAQIDLVNLANNHVLDFTENGLIETLDVLDRNEISHVGAGRNRKEATSPTIISKKGIQVGVLGYTDNEPSWVATTNQPGTRYLEIRDPEGIQEDILTLRKQVDFLIVTLHWGPNMSERPPPHFTAFAHTLIDLGVDLIHGHSAHIFQGVEIYKNKVILYDTGDFVDDYAVDRTLRNDRSFFFTVEVSKKGIEKLTLTPTLISSCQVNLSTGTERDETIQRMRLLSKEFGTSLEEKDGQLVISF